MAGYPSHQREEGITLLRSLTGKHGAKEGARLARGQFPGYARWSMGPLASNGRGQCSWRAMPTGWL